MRGYLEPRGERCFRIRVDFGMDAEGRRRSKSETVHGSKRDAQKRLAQLLREAEDGQLIAAAPQTLEQYLEYWLSNYARHLAARTAQNYTEYVRYYVIPALGQVKLDQLAPHHVQALYTRLQEGGGVKQGKALSSTTVANLHRVLKGALKQAVKWQMIGKNPLDAVVAPKPAEREPRILSQEQVACLLEAAPTYSLYIPVLLALSTGMRRGEVCGLRWQDVSLERGVLAIRQTLVSVGNRQLEFKTPKTKTGKRSVKLPALVVAALAAERARQEECRAVFGEAYNPDGLVVCREDGSRVHPATLYGRFQQLLARLKLPRVAFHDLRHSHATHLLELGVNPKVVSERLGHADVALTLRVYSHVMQHLQDEAAQQTDDLLRRAMGQEPNE